MGNATFDCERMDEIDTGVSTMWLTSTEEESPGFFCFHETDFLSTIDEHGWFDGDSWFQEEDDEEDEVEDVGDILTNTTSQRPKLPDLVIIEGGPLGENHQSTDVSHDAVTPKARSSSFPREGVSRSREEMDVVVRDIASRLVHQFNRVPHLGSSSSWTSTTSSTSSETREFRRFHRKRIILIGEDGDEEDVLVLDHQLDISIS